MTDKKIDVLFGDEAVRKLDPAALDQLAEASERHYVSDESELPDAMRKWHDRIKGVLEEKQIAAVTVGDDNEVVSIAGFHQIGTTNNNRPVFEAGRSVTLTEHRGRGYYKMAMNKILEEIGRLHPNAVIVRATTQETVRKSCLKMGFKPLTAEQYVKYRESVEGEWDAESRRGAKEYDFYYLDLTEER